MKPSYRIAELEKIVDAFRKRAFEAERESDELREQFDKLASAAGWSKEQCEQVGDSPFDVVEDLLSAKRERDELKALAEEQSKLAGHNAARAQKSEAEIARRDASAGEPVAWQYRYNNGKVGDWKTVDSESECNHSPCYERRAIYTAAPPAVLPWHVDSCSNCGSKKLSWDTTVTKVTAVQDGRLKLNEVSGIFYLGCDECSETLLKISADDIAQYINNVKSPGGEGE